MASIMAQEDTYVFIKTVKSIDITKLDYSTRLRRRKEKFRESSKKVASKQCLFGTAKAIDISRVIDQRQRLKARKVKFQFFPAGVISSDMISSISSKLFVRGSVTKLH